MRIHLNVMLYVCCLSCINIMLPSTSWYSKWFHFFRPAHQNPTYICLLSHTCHIPHPSPHLWFGDPNNICRKYKLIHSYVCNFLQPPVTPSQLDLNVLFNTPILDTISQCSSFNVTNQVLHPYKTSYKIMVLYTAVFMPVESKQRDKDSERSGSYHFVFPPTI